MANVTNHSVLNENAKLVENWRPVNMANLNGLFRCHDCFRVFNLRHELKLHLADHLKEAKDLESRLAFERAMRPEDFEEVDTSKRQRRVKVNNGRVAKEGKENNQVAKKPSNLKRRKKSRKVKKENVVLDDSTEDDSEKLVPTKALEKVDEDLISIGCTGDSELSCGRPNRKCKTTANTLVALSLADEKLEIDFEDNSSSSSSDNEDDGGSGKNELQERLAIGQEESEDDKPLGLLLTGRQKSRLHNGERSSNSRTGGNPTDASKIKYKQ